VLVGSASDPPNVLILDEPTNHLDIDSREALEDALRSFKGAILLVSHDRALLDAVGTRTVAVQDRALHSYTGGWPEYVRVREERAAPSAGDAGAGATGGSRRAVSAANGSRGEAGAAAAGSGAKRAGGGAGSSGAAATRKARAARKPAGPSKNRLSEQAKAEATVEHAEAALQALELELAEPAAWATRYEAAKSEARHTAARRAVEEAYARLGALID
jgi:ATP-binding cassette, subfamily F, member 3